MIKKKMKKKQNLHIVVNNSALTNYALFTSMNYALFKPKEVTFKHLRKQKSPKPSLKYSAMSAN